MNPTAHTAPTLAIQPEAMPAALRELAELLGDSEALRLVGQWGGARLPGLLRMQPGHAFRVFMGEAGFAKLQAHFGAETLELPKGDAYMRQLRHDMVRQCRTQGLTMDEIAQTTGYCRRQVINILGGGDGGADVYTMDLFETPAPVSHAGKANNPFGL